jgi:hypothetical protein
VRFRGGEDTASLESGTSACPLWHKRLPPALCGSRRASAMSQVLLGAVGPSVGPLAGTQQGSGGDTRADIAGQQWVRTKIQHGSGRDTAGLVREQAWGVMEYQLCVETQGLHGPQHVRVGNDCVCESSIMLHVLVFICRRGV